MNDSHGDGGMAGGTGGGETAYPVRNALGFTAEQWERVRAFRFEHRFGTEAEAVRRLLDPRAGAWVQVSASHHQVRSSGLA
jgi:hypothetical protein